MSNNCAACSPSSFAVLYCRVVFRHRSLLLVQLATERGGEQGSLYRSPARKRLSTSRVEQEEQRWRRDDGRKKKREGSSADFASSARTGEASMPFRSLPATLVVKAPLHACTSLPSQSSAPAPSLPHSPNFLLLLPLLPFPDRRLLRTKPAIRIIKRRNGRLPLFSLLPGKEKTSYEKRGAPASADRVPGQSTERRKRNHDEGPEMIKTEGERKRKCKVLVSSRPLLLLLFHLYLPDLPVAASPVAAVWGVCVDTLLAGRHVRELDGRPGETIRAKTRGRKGRGLTEWKVRP